MHIIRLFILVILVAISSMAWSQIDYDIYPKVTSTYFINDVHIQKSPQDSFGLGDIVIVDGYISQVGRTLQVPPNAHVIEGDSAYVYPAFIAALSHTGIEKSDSKGERPEVKFRGHPPKKVVGITPEVLAHEQVDPSHESVGTMKENGFAVAHVVPRGKMLPGQGSLLLLEGKTAEEMLYGTGHSLYFQLKGTRGFYPSTVIGVMAKWKELYRQAGYLDKHISVNRISTMPSPRAKSDKCLEALIPLTKGNKTLYMKAEKAKDIHRAIALKKELGYKLVLAEVKQSGPALNKIKANNIPLLISANLPKDAKDKKKKGKDKKGKKPKKEKVPVEEKSQESKKEESPEMKALKKRKKESYDAYVGQASALEKAGISFGFSLLDTKASDIKKSLLRMIEAGLSKDAALAALTTNPARILGIDNKVGTIRNGKMANLFISDGPYFDKESNIKSIFVEGAFTEFEVKKKSKGKGGEDFKSSLSGKWDYEVESPMGRYTGTIKVTGDEDLSILVIDDDEPGKPMKARDIIVGEGTLTFTLSIDMGDSIVPGVMELDIEGNSYDGTLEMEGVGSMPVSGNKISSPE